LAIGIFVSHNKTLIIYLTILTTNELHGGNRSKEKYCRYSQGVNSEPTDSENGILNWKIGVATHRD